MRYAVLADVHANLEALGAVLERLQSLRVDSIISLGDTVGFNANPRECLDWQMRGAIRGVSGNHDLVAAGLMEPAGFAARARTTVLWTRRQLEPEHVRYLQALPQQLVVDGEFVACHANLWDAMERIKTPQTVAKMFDVVCERYAPLRICFFAHTHVPSAHCLSRGTIQVLKANRISLDPSAHYLFNPGSVSESRNGDRRASFVVFDSDARQVEFYRVRYDERSARRKAAAAGLPQRQRGTRLRRLFSRQRGAARGPHAVVLGLGVNGLGVVRSLARQGVPVIGVYEQDRDIGRYSRQCQAIPFPEARVDPSGFLRELYALGKRLNDQPVLFLTTDVQIALVSAEREALGKLFRIRLADSEILDNLMDKAAVVEAAQRCGIATPRTFTFASADELASAADRLPLPCVIKPRYPWRPNQTNIPKVTLLHSTPELGAFLEQHPGKVDQLVFQEVIEGGDADHAFCLVYMNEAHQVAGAVTGESIHRYPPNLGITASCITRDLPELAVAAERFLRAERYVGLAELEFKRDRRDGVYKLYEVNTRTWNYNILGAACGADLVYLAYLDASAQPLPADRLSGQPGYIWVNTDFEVGFFWRNLTRGRLSAFPWRVLAPGTSHSKFAWNDPQPALRGLLNRFRRFSATAESERPEHGRAENSPPLTHSSPAK